MINLTAREFNIKYREKQVLVTVIGFPLRGDIFRAWSNGDTYQSWTNHAGIALLVVNGLTSSVPFKYVTIQE